MKFPSIVIQKYLTFHRAHRTIPATKNYLIYAQKTKYLLTRGTQCMFSPIVINQHTHWTNNALRWRHNGRDGVSNHQPRDCLLNRLFRRESKKTSKLRVTGLCAGNSPGTGEFPAQMASYADNVSIWWRHQETVELPMIWDAMSLMWCHCNHIKF